MKLSKLGFLGLTGSTLCNAMCSLFETCLCIIFIPKTMAPFSYLRLYLGIKTVSCRPLQCDGKDGHGLKLEQLFQVLSGYIQKKI